MKKFTSSMKALTALFMQVAETGLALVAVAIVAYLLLGEGSGAYVISIVTNVSLLVGAITAPAFVAAALIIGLVYMIRNRI